jgi:hypothetical protein
VHVITMAGIVRDAFDKRLNLMRILRPDGTDKALACKKMRHPNPPRPAN